MTLLRVLPSANRTASAPSTMTFRGSMAGLHVPLRRFGCILADAAARLGADVDRYSLHRGGLSPLTPRRFYPGAPYFPANLPQDPNATAESNRVSPANPK